MALKSTLAVAALGLSFTGLALSAQASDPSSTPLAFVYEQFEASVPHIDLETCPQSLPQTDSFCRASIHHEEIHVFAFSMEGDSPLIGFASFPAEGLEPLLK